MADDNDARVVLPPTDAALLAWIKSPPPTLDQAAVVEGALGARRWEVVRRAIEEGALDPNIELRGPLASDDRINLIHAAAAIDHVPLLRFLIVERGIDPNEGDGRGLTPLHASIFSLKERTALFLIEKVPSCDVSARETESGMTPLMTAAGKGLISVLKGLVARGVDVDEKNDEGVSAIVYAVREGHEDAALYLFEEAGAAWHVSDKYSVLDHAAAYGRLRLLKAAVQRMRTEGVVEAVLTKRMQKAARCSIEKGKLAVLKALVEEGLDVTQPVEVTKASYGAVWKSTLLHSACTGADNQEIVAYLVEEKGCDLLAADEQGLLPHHHAAVQGHLPLLEWILAHYSIPIDAAGPSGMSALHVAGVNGQMHVAIWLVQAGANPLLVVTSEQWRPSEAAECNGHDALAVYLREREQAAEAAAQAEQEAAARKARNEKRRQKQKKAKARRRQEQQQQAAAGGGGGGGDDEQEDEQDEEQQEEVMALAAGMGGLVVASEDEEKQQGPPLEPQPEPEPDDTDADHDEALQAAIALSLAVERPPPLEEYLEMHAPDSLFCPISLGLLNDPVFLAGDGCTYSRAAIQQHIDYCHERSKPLTSPKTGLQIDDPADARVKPNHLVRSMVIEYKEAKEREWAAAEQRWQEWMEGQQQKQGET